MAEELKKQENKEKKEAFENLKAEELEKVSGGNKPATMTNPTDNSKPGDAGTI